MACHLTPVERAFIHKSGQAERHVSEKVATITVENVTALGKLTCLRFLEWVQANPFGVIALPTGHTPEMFIEYLKHYKANWDKPHIQAELATYGLDSPTFPDTSQLKFVQLDEFFPLNPHHHNSFTHYVRELYFPLLGLQADNILTMDLLQAKVLTEEEFGCFDHGLADLTLLHRPAGSKREEQQKRILERATAFAADYERRVHELGGIGFFLGGIGPDGHIAFNVKGSPHDSPTRLVTLNYPTAAAASGDLGGIEFARNKVALTIGLHTITAKEDAVIIIMAAGEGKAKVVANALEKDAHPDYPATCLHRRAGARFYVSHGAACQLQERLTEAITMKVNNKTLTLEGVDGVVVEAALALNKRMLDLTVEDMESTSRSAQLLRLGEPLPSLLQGVHSRVVKKVTRGVSVAKDKRILHTAPHHDDIMLSYHAALPDLMATNQHAFAYVTSGFHAVTNSYMLSTLSPVDEAFLDRHHDSIFTSPYPEVITAFVHAHLQAHDRATELEIESVLCLRNIVAIWDLQDRGALATEVENLRAFFQKQLPGDRSPVRIQILKGAMRETEADRMWALRQVHPSQITHLRSKFYTDSFFTPLPTIQDDALPFVRLTEEFNPDIVTVAYDPEGTGPDTHYKVLQIVAQSLKVREGFNPVVWGYRNVWFRFDMSEATVMIPCNDQELHEMNDAFLTCFSTQKAASFPAPDHDGPFSEWSEMSQRKQRQQLGVVLGEDFFLNHPHPKVRGSTGFIFLKEMTKEAFISSAQDLRSRIEA